MAYNEFAYFYDEFNGEADYDALYAHIHAKLKEHGIHDGILADLGCGTGELTLMLTQAGYDMIGIDQSEEMLCVVRDKAEQLGLSGRLLLLRQDLLKLDLRSAALQNKTDVLPGIFAQARTLRLNLLAEGIESTEQLNVLRKAGCTEGQGYLFSRPLSVDEFVRILKVGHSG